MSIFLRVENKDGSVGMTTFNTASQAAETLEVMIQQSLARISEEESVDLLGYTWSKDSKWKCPDYCMPEVQDEICSYLENLQSDSYQSVQKIADAVGMSHILVRKSLLAMSLTGRISKVRVADDGSYKRYKYLINKEV